MRDNAVGAGVIAAFDDGQEGADGIVAAGHFGLEGFIGVELETRDTGFAGFELRQELRQDAITCGTTNHAYPRSTLENSLPFLLGDATKNADDFVLAALSAKITEAGEDFLSSLFADAAGVEEDEAGFFGGINLPIAASCKNASNFLGVVNVHLAAESLDVE